VKKMALGFLALFFLYFLNERVKVLEKAIAALEVKKQ